MHDSNEKNVLGLMHPGMPRSKIIKTAVAMRKVYGEGKNMAAVGQAVIAGWDSAIDGEDLYLLMAGAFAAGNEVGDYGPPTVEFAQAFYDATFGVHDPKTLPIERLAQVSSACAALAHNVQRYTVYDAIERGHAIGHGLNCCIARPKLMKTTPEGETDLYPGLVPEAGSDADILDAIAKSPTHKFH